jgi:hypothetical protein
MKIYVTKHVLKFKGTPTGISEHDSSEYKKLSIDDKSPLGKCSILIDKIGFTSPSEYCVDEKAAIEKALKMVYIRKIRLIKELKAFDQKQEVLRERLYELAPSIKILEELEKDILW